MSQAEQSRALVVFSGGQDSTTCLYWAYERFASVETLSFDYGQRHLIELDAARQIAALRGTPHTVLNLSGFAGIKGNALTDTVAVESGTESSLPTTFVPGRNLIFLTYAAAFAYTKGISSLVTGVCETDYSGYPDCREETIRSLTATLNLGMGAAFQIHTPLMHLTKAETVQLAVEVGALEALAFSHTCYEGAAPPCNVCPACLLRAKGFFEAGIEDPLLRNRVSDAG